MTNRNTNMFSSKHTCTLNLSVMDDQRPSPYSRFHKKCFFYFRTFFTVYANQESSPYFRSNASLNRERYRHLSQRRYRHTIHPLSRFAMRKRCVLFFVWFATFLLDPFLGTFLQDIYFHHRIHPVVVTLYWFIQVVLIIDMITRFYIGYMIRKTREIVLMPSRIKKNYLKNYFFIDFVPFLPTAFWVLYPNLPQEHSLLVYQVRMVRGLRLKSMMRYFDVTLKMCNVDEPIRICLHIVVVGFLLIHWWTCITRLIPTLKEHFEGFTNDSWVGSLNKHRKQKDLIGARSLTVFHDYFQHMALVMCHFFGAAYTRYKIQCPIEMMILSAILINGLLFYIYTLAKIIHLFGMVNIAESKYEKLTTQAREYMISMKFPRKLEERVNRYYDYKYDKTFFSEQQILDSLSEHLRMEVLLYSCQNLVNKVPLFRGLSKAAVGCILALLKQEIYLPDDQIMSSMDQSGNLYFILYGTCAVQLMDGREAMHIEDGSHFGEARMFFGHTTDVLYNVVALECSEIYSLTSKDVGYCCRNYPEITVKLAAMTKERAKYYRAVLAVAETEEEIRAMDIIDELRRGRILHHGMKRDQN